MVPPKSIALVSRADTRGGGASRVADDIWMSIRGDADIKAERYIGEFNDPASKKTHNPITGYGDRLLRSLKKAFAHRGWVDHYPLEFPFLHRGILFADIVHAHDISSVIAPQTLQLLTLSGRRVIWTLHDMSAITGGCIYPIGCSGWRAGCDSCPMLDQWPLQARHDRTRGMQARRLSILRKKSIELVAPSRWLAERVEAAVPGTKVHVIPNGVDIEAFSPAERSSVANSATLLFVAMHIRDMRKGGTYLADIRHHLDVIGRNLELVIVGAGSVGEVQELGRLKIRYLGRVDDRAKLAATYRSANALLLPTHADNFPLVMLESMACGLPVFAFDTGGIAEAVGGDCGAIRRPGDIAGLIDAFFAALDRGAIPALAAAARAKVVERYSMKTFADAHRQLYLSKI